MKFKARLLIYSWNNSNDKDNFHKPIFLESRRICYSSSVLYALCCHSWPDNILLRLAVNSHPTTGQSANIWDCGIHNNFAAFVNLQDNVLCPWIALVWLHFNQPRIGSLGLTNKIWITPKVLTQILTFHPAEGCLYRTLVWPSTSVLVLGLKLNIAVWKHLSYIYNNWKHTNSLFNNIHNKKKIGLSMQALPEAH